MNKRELKLEKYGISGKRYKELCGFCEQYPEWKRELANMSFISGVSIDDMPHSPNKNSDVVANLCEKADKYLSKCRIIETTAQQCSTDLWTYIIDNVCYEISVTNLVANGMPMSERSFYDQRRYFFYLLDKNKGI